MRFRVDDVSVNTNFAQLAERLDLLRRRFPGCEIILAVSPHVFDMSASGEPERIFPRILTAQSDHKQFYRAGKIGMPDLRGLGRFTKASHGLIHVDHRLLPRDVQELSILASCAIVGSSVFVPPFNHWNADTESVCRQHNIQLVKFEDGWRSMEHHAFDPDVKDWYFHTHSFSVRQVYEWCR